MKVLLDTHIFLWAVLGDRRLGSRARRVLERPSTETWLSPISVWETLLLESRARLRLEPTPLRWIQEALGRYPWREAALTHEVAIASRAIGLSHEDPADRFLAATAAVYDLTLLTADEALLEGDGYSVMSNDD